MMDIPKTPGGFSVQASVLISASQERVWSVLTDLEKYSEWNTFIPATQSEFQVGSLLTMQVQMNKRRRVKSVEIITAIEPQRLLAWKTRSPAWLLRGERFQLLTSVNETTTHYQTQESFTGMLVPLLRIFLRRDLQRGFNTMAQNLKECAEHDLG